MQPLSNMGFRVRSGKEYLLFLLGIVSTWQILQVGGIALSTWLTVLTVGYLLLTQGFYFRRDWLLLTMLASALVTLAVSMLAQIPAGFKKAAIMGVIQWGLIFLLCAYVRREESDLSTAAFFRGFDWSCKVQLIWCILQMGAWYVLKWDLNAKIFGELLHMSAETSQYRNGTLACTGLHWHAANLIPVLVYVYFSNRNLFIKGLCFVLVYLTKNATALLAVGFALALDLLRFVKRTLCDRHCALRYKVAVYILLGMVGFVAVSPILLPKLWETVQYLLLRIYQIQNPTEGNESSAVHFNYYKNLPPILKGLPLREVLFGSGLGTSGYRFSVFDQQYVGLIWTVESDPVNIILSTGIVGAFLHYLLLCVIAFRALKQKQTDITFMILVLIASGFVYDNQFLWVQLAEFMCYCRLQQPKTRLTPAIGVNDK